MNAENESGSGSGSQQARDECTLNASIDGEGIDYCRCEKAMRALFNETGTEYKYLSFYKKNGNYLVTLHQLATRTL